MSGYLYGVINVDYGRNNRRNIVILEHKVNGRLSETELDHGDLIQVVDENYKEITIEEITSGSSNDVERNEKKGRVKLPSRHRVLPKVYKEYKEVTYDGAQVRVRLNISTTNEIHSNYKRQFLNQLFEDLAEQRMRHEEAMELIAMWEDLYEQSDLRVLKSDVT